MNRKDLTGKRLEIFLYKKKIAFRIGILLSFANVIARKRSLSINGIWQIIEKRIAVAREKSLISKI